MIVLVATFGMIPIFGNHPLKNNIVKPVANNSIISLVPVITRLGNDYDTSMLKGILEE